MVTATHTNILDSMMTRNQAAYHEMGGDTPISNHQNDMGEPAAGDSGGGGGEGGINLRFNNGNNNLSSSPRMADSNNQQQQQQQQHQRGQQSQRPSDPAQAVSLSLRLECQTWNRDSHELYDYESRNIFTNKFLVRRAARVFRQGVDIYVVGDSAVPPTYTGDYLLSIKERDGKYYIYPADRQTAGPTGIAIRKLWLITKYLCDQTYPLSEGDVMKLGRFKLRVKQIVTSSDNNVNVDYRLDDTDVPVTELTPEEAAVTQCRICLLEGAEENDPLIRACQCKGSIMYVHLDCLRHWVNGRLSISDDANRTCCFIRQIPCELCKATFPSFVTCRGTRMPIVKVPKIEPPFIVLENLVGPNNKGVHLCSLSTKKECKLGRGHESDVRIADVSISRWHATIKFVDGAFQLEDHRSKFGTLVALRKAVMIDRPDHLSVQVGRTVLKFSVTDEMPPTSTEDVLIYPQPSLPSLPPENPSSPGLDNTGGLNHGGPTPANATMPANGSGQQQHQSMAEDLNVVGNNVAGIIPREIPTASQYQMDFPALTRPVQPLDAVAAGVGIMPAQATLGSFRMGPIYSHFPATGVSLFAADDTSARNSGDLAQQTQQVYRAMYASEYLSCAANQQQQLQQQQLQCQRYLIRDPAVVPNTNTSVNLESYRPPQPESFATRMAQFPADGVSAQQGGIGNGLNPDSDTMMLGDMLVAREAVMEMTSANNNINNIEASQMSSPSNHLYSRSQQSPSTPPPPPSSSSTTQQHGAAGNATAPPQ